MAWFKVTRKEWPAICKCSCGENGEAVVQLKDCKCSKPFTTKRKAREYMLRLQANTLQDEHVVQLDHGSTHVKTGNGRTYRAGHKVTTADFRGF